MPKLKLKRTRDEEAASQLRKERKREEKRRSKLKDDGSRKRHRTDHERTGETTERKWASTDEESDSGYGPKPGPSSPRTSESNTKPDYDAIRAEIEEQRFQEKMFEAFEDDERLDALEARLNDFAHVPERWRPGGGGKPGKAVFDEYTDDFLNMDPRYMDDEEYTEWIRVGMYRKTHADEYAEQQRKKALNAARKAEEKARKAETKRLEKLAEEERMKKKIERQNRKWDYAREEYDIRWKKLLSNEKVNGSKMANQELGFDDIPWPILAAHRQKPDKRGSTSLPESIPISLEQLTMEAISQFLLSTTPGEAKQSIPLDTEKKDRKEKLRETILRFHPDKFEGRFMTRVKVTERDVVREGIGRIVRALNALMDDSM